MSVETLITDSNLQRDVVLAYIERERETWLTARAAAQRAGGMSGEANKAQLTSMNMLNALLDELIEVDYGRMA